MKILLLVSSFNGLTQRVWCSLREQGHDVGVELAPVFETPEALTAAVEAADPDLVLCPFLKDRVPPAVHDRWPTVVLHPGPVGDRGPSSLDHAILERRDRWGVTALSAVEQMDAGPVWATATFDMPGATLAKGALYNSLVADAALTCVQEVVRKVADGLGPVPAEDHPRSVASASELPMLRRERFRLEWSEPAEDLARRVAAADGAPGAPATVGDRELCLFDAVATDDDFGAPPGTVVGRNLDAVAIATGRGTLWVGYAAELGIRRGVKLPAATVLGGDAPFRRAPDAFAETVYVRDGDVGHLTIRSYNGAMHTEQCRRLTTAVEKALIEDTRVLVLNGTEHAFSNGIHLGVIDAAPDPAAEAWENICAIDELCLAIASAEQLTVAAFTANAGAGGVMAGLCADVTLARDGVVLNPYYDMGIFGSELHTWSVAGRVGAQRAERLLSRKLPLSVAEAARIGMISAVGPREWGAFQEWLAAAARGYAEPATLGWMLAQKAERRARSKPLSYYQTIELAEMARDFFDDRNGFAARRKAFLRKTRPAETPARLRFA
ncbi:enoyl-CoA hydratase-related protein [Antribacter sp. KLBMP9083]|uniref:Enoyl-CoA hydratase-related protein n=1 Tax=Antribacter soli TaxID=2910976 RepID=A0AA41Q9W6_9MICO|nr:enoyl-CoA hydratase-related protein [Antribacter soli]MCF4119554.1 enoyl-CoA hydratase-related protein [Antribacter soli]